MAKSIDCGFAGYGLTVSIGDRVFEMARCEVNVAKTPETLGDLIDVYEAWRTAVEALRFVIGPHVVDTVVAALEANRDKAAATLGRQLKIRDRQPTCSAPWYVHKGRAYCYDWSRNEGICRFEMAECGDLPIL